MSRIRNFEDLDGADQDQACDVMVCASIGQSSDAYLAFRARRGDRIESAVARLELARREALE